MNVEYVRAVIDALRSGKYTQGIGRLRLSETCFCAEGVALDVAIVGGWLPSLGWEKGNIKWYWTVDGIATGTSFMPGSVALLLGPSSEDLIRWNDCEGCTFPEIADLLEERLNAETGA